MTPTRGPMDTKARLVGVIKGACGDVGAWTSAVRTDAIADALLAEGVTLPEPPGPVTSEEARVAALRVVSNLSGQYDLRRRMDAELMPLLLRDHRAVSLAEVERRARAWMAGSGYFSGAESLVAALTREG